MAQMDVGKVAAIEVKIRIDMPLPTPRSVIISPSHMIRPVPAVIVATISVIVTSESFGMTGTGQPGKRLPDRATATYVVDCSTAEELTPGVGTNDPSRNMAMIPRVNSSLRRRSGVLKARTNALSTGPPGARLSAAWVVGPTPPGAAGAW